MELYNTSTQKLGNTTTSKMIYTKSKQKLALKPLTLLLSILY